MRILPLDERAIGERLVYDLVDSAGRTLLSAGATITPRYLALLQGRGYASVPVDNPLAPDLTPTDPLPPALRKRITDTVAASFQRVEHRTVAVTSALRSVVNDVLAVLQKSTALTYNLLGLHSLDTYFFVHAVDVCIHSLIITPALALDDVDKRHLGIGAILHDIGMVYYDGLLSQPDTRAEGDLARVRQHTTDGFELLRRQSEVDLRSAHIALQHHERLDGSGYPRGLSGEKMHPWAKVVAIAEVFDSATSSRNYAPTLSAAEGLDLLQAEAQAGHLDPYLVAYFLRHMARYPVGTIVELGNGAVGITEKGDVPGREPARVRVLSADGRTLVPATTLEADGTTPAATVVRTLSDWPSELRQEIG